MLKYYRYTIHYGFWLSMSDIEHLKTTDYKFLLENETIIYVNQFHCVCSTRTGDVPAGNQEQLEALIAYLQKIKTNVSKTPYWLSDTQSYDKNEL